MLREWENVDDIRKEFLRDQPHLSETTVYDELFSETAAGQRTDTWKDWLHVNFGMTVGTASKYMQEHYSKPHVIEKKKSARAASNASG